MKMTFGYDWPYFTRYTYCMLFLHFFCLFVTFVFSPLVLFLSLFTQGIKSELIHTV